ncbi:MAG: glycosyltransferase family 2 protein [Phycisphaerales bacterium]|nr:glycosyltransferase family 2 protein [Phycisphaerales bacterium]
MSGTQPNISAVILTKDEESNVARCIGSLGFCREIVVLDSGSSDRTAEIAQSLGATVRTHVPPKPFRISDQRNWILDHHEFASDWILFLDADETVPDALRARLVGIASGDASHSHYELTPRYLFMGRWLKRTLGYPNWHARLMRRGATRFAGGVWEHFDSPIPPGRIPEPYDHFAYSKGLSDWLARHDRYSSWDAQKVVDYLKTGRAESLGTARKARLRTIAARLWPVRPLARFVSVYVLRLGFLEGWQSLVYSLLLSFYEMMTVVKVIEIRRRERGLPL